jgi:hypothetical protein
MLSQLGEEAYETLLKTEIPSKIFSDFDYQANKEYHSKENRLHYNSVLQPWINYFCKVFLVTDDPYLEVNGARLRRSYDMMGEQKNLMMKEFFSLNTTHLDHNKQENLAFLARFCEQNLKF